MTVNDGKGLFDKFGMIEEMLKKLDALADARGTFRAGLIWDISQMLVALKRGLTKEDEQHKESIACLEKAAGVEKIDIESVEVD